MAWTAPRTWVPTELVTKTMLDAHVRDNLNALSRMVEVFVDPNGFPNSGSGPTLAHDWTTPAGLLASDGDSLRWTVHGVYATNGAAKSVTAYIESNLVATTGTVTSNGTGFVMLIELRRMTSAIVLACALVMQTTTGSSVQLYAYGSIPWSSGAQLELYLDGDASNDLFIYTSAVELKRNGA